MRDCSVSAACFCILLFGGIATSQDCQTSVHVGGKPAPLSQRLLTFSLENETIFEGLGKINEQAELAISVEGIAGEPRGAIPRFSLKTSNQDVRGMLGLVVGLDQRYTWKLDGRTINVFPRSVADDSNYLLNRRVPVLTISNAKDVDEAVNQVMLQAAADQPILLDSMGSPPSFAEPWSVVLKDCSLREIFNRIAARSGPTYGWQFVTTRSRNFRQLNFHSRLAGPRRPNADREIVLPPSTGRNF